MYKLQKWQVFGSVFTATFLLSFWAFHNTFPIVFPDTGAYLGSGFTNIPPADRPIFYGWFLRHLSLSATLYLPVLLQGMSLAYLLWLWVYQFGNTRWVIPQYILLIFILTFFTGASLQVSQLLPDVFASCMLLALGLLLLGENLSRSAKIGVSLLFYLSTVMHNSHALIAWLILFLSFGYWVFIEKNKIIQLVKKPRLLLIAGVLIMAQLSIPTSNWLAGEGFVSSRATHVFLMNRMVDWGVVDQYLTKSCPEKQYEFCEYKDQIPRANFLWDFDNSPLYKTGGWEENKQEYDEILSGIFKSPKLLRDIFVRSIEATFQQFFRIEIGDTTRPNNENSLPHLVIKKYFPELERSYFWALQQRSQLDFATLNLHHKYLIGLMFCLSCIVLLIKNIGRQFSRHIAFFLACLLANAAVCGVLSGVFDRYQCRVVFLIIIPLYLYFWQFIINKFFIKSPSIDEK